MKFLIIDSFLHHKNNAALNKMLDFLNYEYKLGTIEDISDYDVIYMPSTIIDISKYKDKKFIFGPHLSVFPTEQLLGINNIYKNGVYIQPSDWSAEVWRNFGVEELIPIKILPFSVDIDRFSPKDIEKDIIMVYTKRRHPQELNYVINFLTKNQIKYIIFDYVKSYKEKDYIRALSRSKCGIIIDAHESQGFAIEEALSCNVPLFVWNVKYMSQEYMSRYKDIPCTTIPYWDESCGDFFYEHSDFENKFETFLKNIEENKYEPRNFILNNLSVLNCAYKLKDIIESI